MSDGVIRMDLVQRVPGPEDKVTLAKAGNLALTLPGFLRTLEQMNQLAAKLAEQGLLKRNDPPKNPEAAGVGGKLN